MASTSSQMVISGLQSVTNGISSAGNYDIIGSLTLPGIANGASANSQVVTTVSHNGSPIFTSQAGSEGFTITNLPCAAGDTITVALTSAAAVDQGLNVVKCTVAIG